MDKAVVPVHRVMHWGHCFYTCVISLAVLATTCIQFGGAMHFMDSRIAP